MEFKYITQAFVCTHTCVHIVYSCFYTTEAQLSDSVESRWQTVCDRDITLHCSFSRPDFSDTVLTLQKFECHLYYMVTVY